MSRSAYDAAVNADLPDGFWKLDETVGATTAVDSVAGKNGTKVGTVTFGVSSVINTGVSFGGAVGDGITLPDTGAWAAAQMRTSIECMFRLAAPDGRDHYLVSGNVGGGTLFNGFRILPDGKIRGVISYGPANNWSVDSTTSFADNQWHHLVLTFDGIDSDMNLYVDGTLNATAGTTFGTAMTASTGWSIGRNTNRSQGCLAQIDEVAIYADTKLDATRVAAHYAAIGAPVVLVVSPTGIASAAAFGIALVSGGVLPTQNLTVTGIATRAAFGTPGLFSVSSQPGETYQIPLEVTEEGDVDVDSWGDSQAWERDAEETALGAEGLGTFWFRVTTERRTLVTVNYVSDAEFYMRAYVVVDPLAPITPDNLALAAEGTDVAVVAVSNFLVMVDVITNVDTATFSFAYVDASQGAISMYVVSDLGGSVTEAQFGLSPASLSATVSATSDVTSFDAIFDGTTVLSNVALQADYTWSGLIPIPSRPAGTYSLVLHADGADVMSDTIQVTIEHSSISAAPLPDDIAITVPSTAVGRWAFVDPALDVQYYFPMNPQTASTTNAPRNHSVESTTRPVAFVVYEGATSARSYTFGGLLLDEEMYRELAAWSLLNRRVWLIDHNLIAWQVVPQKFDVKPRTNRLNPWIQDYEFTVLLLKGPTQAEVL